MELKTNLASAAVNTALRGLNMTHKQVSEYLSRAAAIDPGVLRAKIKELKAQIELLEAYLPKAA